MPYTNRLGHLPSHCKRRKQCQVSTNTQLQAMQMYKRNQAIPGQHLISSLVGVGKLCFPQSLVTVWDGISGCLSDKLQKLQNRAARVITQSPFDTSSNLLLAMLKWEKLSLRRKKQKALIMYKTLNELAPDYLQCLFTQRHVNDYNLRNLEGKLSLPRPNTNYLKRSFCYSGSLFVEQLAPRFKKRLFYWAV